MADSSPRHLLFLTCALCVLQPAAALVPTEEQLIAANSSGIVFQRWERIGRVVLNQPAPAPHYPECCATNFSAAWDLDDELIVLSADNIFCPETLERLRADALEEEFPPWEQYDQLIDRIKTNKQNGEAFYTGNFPGVTKFPLGHDSLLQLRRCFSQFVPHILDSEQFRVMLEVLPDEIQGEPLYFRDAVKSTLMIADGATPERDDEHSVGDSVRDAGAGDYSDEELCHPDDATCTSAADPALAGNPIIPTFYRSFWASVAVPVETLRPSHSAPHIDGTEAGIASVFTMTRDPRYEATGTAVMYEAQSKRSKLHTSELEQLTSTNNDIVQKRAVENGLPRNSGWLNFSQSGRHGNRFAAAIATAMNKHNRITLYPSNRLHTAMVPDESLLNSDPRKGRLTMNTFWSVFLAQDGERFCSNVAKAFMRDRFDTLDVFPRDSSEHAEACTACTNWRFCGWCPSTRTCMPKHRADERCPASDILIGSTHDEDVCLEVHTRYSECPSKRDCTACHAQEGCTWCHHTGICSTECLFDSHREGPVDLECAYAGEPAQCIRHEHCVSCLQTDGCAWCASLRVCMADGIEGACSQGALIDGRGEQMCPSNSRRQPRLRPSEQQQEDERTRKYSLGLGVEDPSQQ